MTYLPEYYMIVIYTWQSKVRKRKKCIRYLSYSLFTVNPIKLNVIHLLPCYI